MAEKIIKKYGEHWERSKMFGINNGRVAWTKIGWPEINPPLKNAKGLYVL